MACLGTQWQVVELIVPLSRGIKTDPEQAPEWGEASLPNECPILIQSDKESYEVD